MTTTRVDIDIVCPDWCTIDPHEHAACLSEQSGSCFHWSRSWFSDDPTGYWNAQWGTEPRFSCQPIEVRVTTSTTVDGKHDATPLIFIDDADHTIEQVETLIASLCEAVDLLKGSDGRVSA